MSDFATIQGIFNKILEYFKNHKITIIEKKFNNNPSEDIVFNLVIQAGKYSLSISYMKSMKTFVLFHVTMTFKPEDVKAIKSLKESNKARYQQFFMDFRKTVYPLNVNFEINMPNFMLTKEITVESCNDEQFFMDQVHNMLHAEELVAISFDEFFYSIYPHGKPKDDEYI